MSALHEDSRQGGHHFQVDEPSFVVSRVLLTGLGLAVGLLLVGVVLSAAGGGASVPHETSITGLPRALRALRPVGFFDLGLIVLLATPVARVVALLVAFSRRRLWIFAGICIVVMAVLALSAFLGLRVE
jgi:uncharacterized membrane protein